MRTSTIATIVIILAVVFVAGAYFHLSLKTAATNTTGTATGTPEIAPTNAGPSTGSTGSRQAGGAAPGSTQVPLADGAEGSVVGDNIVLGTDGNERTGAYLIAYNGMTLYTYAADTDVPGKSACYAQCATNWPPYLVGPEDNMQHVKAGVRGEVGTIIRKDGGIQVTYNGKPLYFYKADRASGDVKGENVGGVWFVVKP